MGQRASTIRAGMLPSCSQALPGLAATVGWLHELLLALMALTIVISIQTVGIVLVVAMLVTPAANATLLVRRFPLVMLVGAIQGVVGVIVGLYLSFYLNIASGATIVLVLTSMFVLTLIVAPRLGRQRRAPHRPRSIHQLRTVGGEYPRRSPLGR
jgi:drug/metabolite transporter (DMT)-like permease